MRSAYRSQIEAACAPVGWDPDLLEAQVLIESSDNPWAFRYEPAYYVTYIRGNTGAAGYLHGPLAACSYGLLQLLGETALEMRPSRPDGSPFQIHDLFDPATNLRLALRYLVSLQSLVEGRDVVGALAAYNGGPGDNLHPPYRNLLYAQKVLTQKERLHVDHE